jgi:tRNA(Ile)-lysidine synthase
LKQELVEYCSTNHLEFVEDPTNRDPAYFRNWLRLELIPKIETFNPRFQESLTKSSRSLQADAEILNRAVDTAWVELGVREGNGYLVLPRMGMTRLETGIRYRIIRKAILRLRSNLRDISFDLVERFARFVDSPPATRSMDLGAELNLHLVGDQIYLIRHGYAMPTSDFPQIKEPIELPFPSRLTLQNGWEINIETKNADDIPFDAIRSAGRWEAWLDQDQIQAPMRIGMRFAGDRFSPLGSGSHSIKISDLFINYKIPSLARSNYPLIRDLTSIIWVPGIQIADHVRVTIATRRIIHLRIRKTVPA